MSTDWAPLTEELQIWARQGRTLPLWWRDDDAVSPSHDLDRLLRLSARLALPVHLAIIPAKATAALAQIDGYVPVVHGWSHHSHAGQNEKKAEFGDHRPMSALVSDADLGLKRLGELFGARLRPMFVPPWNRIAPTLLPQLPKLGYTSVSTFTARKTRSPEAGLVQINTHVDPIDWRTSRGLARPDHLIHNVAAQLIERRTGHADPNEPFGVLTHHLVHSEEIWEWTEALLDRLLSTVAKTWVHPTPQENLP
ncbi:MAG: polysaccharide deacetylase [Pseudomonadota bacterium]